GRRHRALHRGRRPGHAHGSPRRPRRLAPRSAGAAEARAGARRAQAARLRAPGRRQGDGGARPRPPHHPQARAVGLARHRGPRRAEPAGTDSRAGARRAMTWRPTPLVTTLLTVVAWAVCLAVLTARAELLFVALPLVAAMLTLSRRAAVPEY